MRRLRPGILDAVGELGRLAGDVADVDWQHPAWWALVGGTAFLERAAAARTSDGDMYATFLAANGGPRSDTFMARDRAGAPALEGRVAQALVRAHAAVSALTAHDREFPDQPLLRSLAWEDGWLRRVPLPAGAPQVAFITPTGVYLARLPAAPFDPAASEWRRLAAALAGMPEDRLLTRTDPDAPAPVRAPVAVSLLDHPLATARHLHRHAWSAGGGPWLGVGTAGDKEIVTTCHLIVDGYGHARISTTIFATIDRSLPTPTPTPDSGSRTAGPIAGEAPLGFAATVLPANVPFARYAYATGRAVERIFRAHLPPHVRAAARHTPTFQIPIAPGAWNDPRRRQRRVLFGLASVRMVDGEFEPYAAFAARVRAHLDREARAAGLLWRVLAATSSAPLPASLKRRLLATESRPSPWLPPVEVLGGRACLSTLRFPAGERPPAPLYACSSPGLAASPSDPRGAVVLTLVHHGETMTASACGTGLAGTDAGARAFLDAWLAELSA